MVLLRLRFAIRYLVAPSYLRYCQRNCCYHQLEWLVAGFWEAFRVPFSIEQIHVNFILFYDGVSYNSERFRRSDLDFAVWWQIAPYYRRKQRYDVMWCGVSDLPDRRWRKAHIHWPLTNWRHRHVCLNDMIIMNPVMRVVLIEHIINKVPDDNVFVCDIWCWVDGCSDKASIDNTQQASWSGYLHLLICSRGVVDRLHRPKSSSHPGISSVHQIHGPKRPRLGGTSRNQQYVCLINTIVEPYLCITISTGPGVCIEFWIRKAVFEWYLFELVNCGPSELWIAWCSFSPSLWITSPHDLSEILLTWKKQSSTTLHFPMTGCTWNFWYTGYSSSKSYNQLSSLKWGFGHSLLITLEMFKSLIKWIWHGWTSQPSLQ